MLLRQLKRFLANFVLLLAVVGQADAIELKVKSFTSDPMNMEARTERRNDYNDNPCALILVDLPVEGCTFAGNVIGDVNYRTNHYRVYVTAGTKMLQIQCPGAATLFVDTLNKGKGVEGLTTYHLVLDGYEKLLPTAVAGVADYFSIQGHEYVDMGLPSGLLWAKTNVGAETPAETGAFFQWGHTEISENYSFATALNGRTEVELSGNVAFDVATKHWGDKWRVPTAKELQELVDACKWTWTTIDGQPGCKVTGPNGNYIFLPAAGYIVGVKSSDARKRGLYLSMTPSLTHHVLCYGLDFNKKERKVAMYFGRNTGYTVRPVTRK